MTVAVPDIPQWLRWRSRRPAWIWAEGISRRKRLGSVKAAPRLVRPSHGKVGLTAVRVMVSAVTTSSGGPKLRRIGEAGTSSFLGTDPAESSPIDSTFAATAEGVSVLPRPRSDCSSSRKYPSSWGGGSRQLLRKFRYFGPIELLNGKHGRSIGRKRGAPAVGTMHQPARWAQRGGIEVIRTGAAWTGDQHGRIEADWFSGRLAGLSLTNRKPCRDGRGHENASTSR